MLASSKASAPDGKQAEPLLIASSAARTGNSAPFLARCMTALRGVG
jgi:hypothetical protein